MWRYNFVTLKVTHLWRKVTDLWRNWQNPPKKLRICGEKVTDLWRKSYGFVAKSYGFVAKKLRIRGEKLRIRGEKLRIRGETYFYFSGFQLVTHPLIIISI